MLKLDSNAVVFAAAGPSRIGDLETASSLLCARAGQLQWVGATVRPSASTEVSAISLCSDMGQVVTSADCRIVTSAGLVSAGDLLAMRYRDAIGRMDGEWPSLERPQLEATLIGPGLNADELSATIARVGRIGASDQKVVRLGNHATNELVRFMEIAVHAESELEAGQLGWTWMRPTAAILDPSRTRADVRDVAMASLTLWQPGADADYVLPVELGEVAMMTTALLAAAGLPFALDFRPRYAPIQVALRLTERRSAHAALQAIRLVRPPAMVDVDLAASGAYLIGSGHLIGH